jgi:hypothetical protein
VVVKNMDFPIDEEEERRIREVLMKERTVVSQNIGTEAAHGGLELL